MEPATKPRTISDLEAPRVREVSDSHARGLRRRLFDLLAAHAVRDRKALLPRLAAARWPHRSAREAGAAYRRAAESLERCSLHFNEKPTTIGGRVSCAVLVVPDRIAHADGSEPVLSVRVVMLETGHGRVMLEGQRCGRVSHHAIERMYQRLRTNDHEVVVEELRGAMFSVAQLWSAASLTRRSAAIRQWLVPTRHGVLRCLRGAQDGEVEARTFTPYRPGSRFDLSAQAVRRWQDGAKEGDDAGFAALLRDPANRWWRQPYGG